MATSTQTTVITTETSSEATPPSPDPVECYDLRGEWRSTDVDSEAFLVVDHHDDSGIFVNFAGIFFQNTTHDGIFPMNGYLGKKTPTTVVFQVMMQGGLTGLALSGN